MSSFLALSRKNYINIVSLISALLMLSFFVSGCSALIYQVSWQRALYVLIGVDIDSITIIVSIFMLGIGLGGALGGWISDSFPRHRILFYAGIEFAIATYGALSLGLVHQLELFMNTNLLNASSGGGAVACVLFLTIPTILMGMTLPLLTMAFNERYANIGVSIGRLYFTNTLGAAVGAAMVPFVLLPALTLPQVIWVAVTGNIGAVVLALLAKNLSRRI